MGVTTEYCDLVYRVTGQDQAKALEDALVRQQGKVDGLKSELEVLRSAYERGVKDGADYRVESDRLTAAISKEEVALERLETRQAKLAAAMATARTAQASAAKDVYELADAYEVLGTKSQSVLTSAATVPSGKNLWSAVVSGSDAARAESTMVRFGNAAIDTGNKVTTSGRKMESAFKGSSYALLNFSRATQDFAQGGLAGILNNVEGMLLPFGAGLAKLAGPATILATVGYLVYQNWGQVLRLFGAGHEIPKAASDLEGLKQKLHETSKELEDLNKQGFLSNTNFARRAELIQAEKDVKEAIKVKEAIEHFSKLKTDKEEEVGKALAEALKAGDSDKVLEKLKATSVSGLEDSEKFLYSIKEGSLEAYNQLIDIVNNSAEMKDSKFAAELKRLQPLDKTKDVDVFEEAAHQANLKNAEAAVALGKQMTKEGLASEGEFIKELADKTREGITKGIGDKLRDILVRTRAAGSTGAKEIPYLTDKIADEMARLFPELKAFPTVFANVAQELARTVKLSVDETIKEIQQAEGLTKQEAIRRLNQHRAEKMEGKTGELAQDEFTAFAQRQNAQQRRFDPMVPQIMPAEAREQARAMQDQLRELNVNVQQQVAIGKLMNDPAKARFVPGALDALGARGFDQGQALRMLPQLFQQLQGKNAAGGIPQAAERVARGVERAERGAFNLAAAQPGKVPLRPARPAVPAIHVPERPLNREQEQAKARQDALNEQAERAKLERRAAAGIPGAKEALQRRRVARAAPAAPAGIPGGGGEPTELPATAPPRWKPQPPASGNQAAAAVGRTAGAGLAVTQGAQQQVGQLQGVVSTLAAKVAQVNQGNQRLASANRELFRQMQAIGTTALNMGQMS